ncbi:MAG: DUF359 domain-containing protein [Candidatus Aenigmatarchaeota archaeon]|nr:MAG: DUF359 domain-containing protein [Candidatus Aenigmarchaeota archaeon]
MIVAISGTPGTGKTSSARMLSEITGMELISLNELADRKGLHKGYDDERYCKIVDLKGIVTEIKKLKDAGRNVLIEAHYAHEMPADLVIVLRTNPGEMRKRGREKGWGFEKTEENVLAEIMEECKIESLVKGRNTRELDTTGKTAKESAEMMARLLQHEGLFVYDRMKIPDKMREELRQPYGKLFEGIKQASAHMKGGDIIAVGDEAGFTLHSSGTTPAIMIVDGKIRRKRTEKRIDVECETIRAKNETGYVTRDMWVAVGKAIKTEKPVKVEIEGEEDMAVLPAVLLGKDSDFVVYGLFDRGLCVVKINEETRKTFRNTAKKIASSQ